VDGSGEIVGREDSLEKFIQQYQKRTTGTAQPDHEPVQDMTHTQDEQ